MSDELAPRDGLGEECVTEQCVDVMEGSGSTHTDCSPTPGCKSFVPLIKVWLYSDNLSSLAIIDTMPEHLNEQSREGGADMSE